jgi:soluble P-type ATPase
MKNISIPKFGKLHIENVIFDINGTIQFQGEITDQVVEKIKILKEIYNIYLISSDTRGNLKDIAKRLSVDYVKINAENMTDAKAKSEELNKLGKNSTIAVGNGNNDALMLKNAGLGILIIGSEGAGTKSLKNADVVFTSPIDVIDFLMDEKAMIATLRG